MKVFHFINSQYGLENLTRRRLKIATFNDLNDPFELLSVNLGDAELRRAFVAVKQQLAVGRGILCFSRHWRNPVQWSHYADGHRGLCLGFEIPDKHITAVKYSSKRLAITAETLLNPPHMNEALALKFLTTKFSHWRYEAEMRCFLSLEDKDPVSNLYFADFSENLGLVQVIVGAASAIARGEVSDALGELKSSVEVFRARLAFKTFDVVRQTNEALWK